MGSIPSILVLVKIRRSKLNFYVKSIFSRNSRQLSYINRNRVNLRTNSRKLNREVSMVDVTGMTVSNIKSEKLRNAKTSSTRIRSIKASSRKFLKFKSKFVSRAYYNTYGSVSLSSPKQTRRLLSRDPVLKPTLYKQLLRFRLFIRSNYGSRLRSKRGLSVKKAKSLLFGRDSLGSSSTDSPRLRNFRYRSRLSELVKKGLQNLRKRFSLLKAPYR